MKGHAAAQHAHRGAHQDQKFLSLGLQSFLHMEILRGCPATATVPFSFPNFVGADEIHEINRVCHGLYSKNFFYAQPATLLLI